MEETAWRKAFGDPVLNGLLEQAARTNLDLKQAQARLIQARALDAEGDQWLEEPTENIGTRHRSVHYLCHQIPEALGIVLSQDGNVRFIKRRDGRVTYWEQAISFAMKIS